MSHRFDVMSFDGFALQCQINTDPMKSQLGYLDVVVPPDIIDYQTSHDMVIEEGQNVTLKCSAVGLPEPTIEWRREGKKPLLSIGSEEGLKFKIGVKRSDKSCGSLYPQFSPSKDPR